jgi:DNA-binding NarL/FixJ family response regulator
VDHWGRVDRAQSDSDNEPPIPVLVVDDRDSFRSVMLDVVAAASGFAVAGEASSGEAALEAIPVSRPGSC